VFPTSKVVTNISPIRQKRLMDMLTVADNFMKQHDMRQPLQFQDNASVGQCLTHLMSARPIDFVAFEVIISKR